MFVIDQLRATGRHLDTENQQRLRSSPLSAIGYDVVGISHSHSFDQDILGAHHSNRTIVCPHRTHTKGCTKHKPHSHPRTEQTGRVPRDPANQSTAVIPRSAEDVQTKSAYPPFIIASRQQESFSYTTPTLSGPFGWYNSTSRPSVRFSRSG